MEKRPWSNCQGALRSWFSASPRLGDCMDIARKGKRYVALKNELFRSSEAQAKS